MECVFIEPHLELKLQVIWKML